MRGQMVAAAVPGEEGDPTAGDLAEEEGVAGRPVRGVHPDLGHVVEERVEPRAPDHADLGLPVVGPHVPGLPVVGLHLVRHARTLTVSHHAEDPVVGRRQGLVRSGCYAAVEPAEELPEPEDDEEEDDEDDEPESEDDEDDEEAEDEAAFEDDDAGELLEELPRLSLR
ncbi:hypothetical protein STPH1_4180 [Streptomyces sp. OM5714]|nr:hypothetical protein STPH1_4180 [Streptomyces sp. OM5714]